MSRSWIGGRNMFRPYDPLTKCLAIGLAYIAVGPEAVVAAGCSNVPMVCGGVAARRRPKDVA